MNRVTNDQINGTNEVLFDNSVLRKRRRRRRSRRRRSRRRRSRRRRRRYTCTLFKYVVLHVVTNLDNVD